jgi:hypothetical protein
MSIDTIEMWHLRARPRPTEVDLNVQLGCHVEEFAEMLESLALEGYSLVPLIDTLTGLAEGLKHGTITIDHMDRKLMLDALADQVVTAIGVGYCANMKSTEAVYRVNRSNWSKFDHEGQPIRDANGKITKGPNYEPPNLDGLY